METPTTDTTHTQTDKTETDPDQTTRVEVIPVRVSERSVLLSGMMEFRVGRSSSLGAKSLAGSTGTDQAQAPLLPLTETERHGIGTRNRRLTGISPVNTGQSPVILSVMAALSHQGTRGLSLDPTSAHLTCQ